MIIFEQTLLLRLTSKQPPSLDFSRPSQEPPREASTQQQLHRPLLIPNLPASLSKLTKLQNLPFLPNARSSLSEDQSNKPPQLQTSQHSCQQPEMYPRGQQGVKSGQLTEGLVGYPGREEEEQCQVDQGGFQNRLLHQPEVQYHTEEQAEGR